MKHLICLTLVLTSCCEAFVPVPVMVDQVVRRRSNDHFEGNNSLLQVSSSSRVSGKDVDVKSPKYRNTAILDFLAQARRLGPVGSDRSKEDQQELLEQARAIAKFSDNKPSRYPLAGIHNMVYSAAPGGSSGKIGPFYGKVQQEFVDDTTFINSVQLGPLKIALRAERKIIDDTRIKVMFRETSIYLFGVVVKTQDISNQGGVWKCLFSGKITTNDDSQQKLVRILETPSLFVIEQNLE